MHYAPSAPLKFIGKNILVAEDEYLPAASLDRELAILGATVVIAGSCIEALHIIEVQPVDVAILDVQLADGDSFSIARLLQRRGTPFLFVTGYGQITDEFADVPLVLKPIDRDRLLQELSALLR